MSVSYRPPSVEEILAATAHELRLPLSHIKGFVSALRRTDVEWDPETRSAFIAEIEQETDRLGELIESLLSTPRSIHKSAMNMGFIQPTPVIKGGLHRVRGLLHDRPLQVDLPRNLPSVRMDASGIERVLANLIQNAIKYSPPGTPIGISARMTEDGELELAVEDEGPGISGKDRQRIFEPFYRGHTSEQSDVAGHGLGLAIVQSIVAAHGGRMQVTNRPGTGARFSVFLPAQRRVGQSDDTAEVRRRRSSEHEAEAALANY